MDRTPTTRRYAERALGLFALELGEHARDITVVGGLNPDHLTRTTSAPHQGTTDVDVLVEVGFVYDRDDLDLSWLETGLRAAGFTTRGDETWRWWIDIDGVPVKLELLCDTPDSPSQQIVLPGCDSATAMNVRGPRPALYDTTVRAVDLAEDSRPARTAQVRFAGLGGYLLAKAAAVIQRGLRKDFYDFTFVLLHNLEGGAAAAGRAARRAVPSTGLDDYGAVFLAALDLYAEASVDGPATYAEQRTLDGDDTDPDVLREDAVSAAHEARRGFSEG